MNNISKYYVVSLKHTRENDPYITLWNPNNAGYCYRTEAAGKYSHDEVMESLNYYNSGEGTLAVSCETINKLTEKVEPGYLDETGMVIPNSQKNWLTIMYNPIATPAALPRPEYNF